MTWFGRMLKNDRGYDGTFAAKGKGAPPPHVRDKNKSHSGQGALLTIPNQEGSLAEDEKQADGSNGSIVKQDEEKMDTTAQ